MSTATTEREVARIDTAPPPFEPYIPAETTMAELTVLPLVVGTVLGMIFGASSLYLVLKVGLTVSASIPVAVISIALFRALPRLLAASISSPERRAAMVVSERLRAAVISQRMARACARSTRTSTGT